MLRFVLYVAAFSLTGCGAVVATVDTAASVAGDVVEGTAHVVSAPLRSDEEQE
ncbi:MAG TPA: hypothetical protein VD978_15585 [Azospirillum sp.]|nr:hypothetical protein [Azospirillum sp.]